MTQRKNNLGQPIGNDVVNWQPARVPPHTSMRGRLCRLEPLDAERHAQDLFDEFSRDEDGGLWTYMVVGPFASFTAFRDWLVPASKTTDPLFYAVVEAETGHAVGLAAYLRIKPESGVIEVGSISYSPRLQRTAMATETMFLMMQRVFDELGYRRYEWKCDSLNSASRRAAERLGFKYEGSFEQALVYKGRNRDTAWYSMLDRDWPAAKNAYLQWLDADNFDAGGRQKRKLEDLATAEFDRNDDPGL